MKRWLPGGATSSWPSCRPSCSARRRANAPSSSGNGPVNGLANLSGGRPVLSAELGMKASPACPMPATAASAGARVKINARHYM